MEELQENSNYPSSKKNTKLIQLLEALSKDIPDKVIRIRGFVTNEDCTQEILEILIFKGFSSSTTHQTEINADKTISIIS